MYNHQSAQRQRSYAAIRGYYVLLVLPANQQSCVYLISRVSLPVHEFIFSNLVLDRPQPGQHDASVQLGFSFKISGLGRNYKGGKHAIRTQRSGVSTWIQCFRSKNACRTGSEDNAKHISSVFPQIHSHTQTLFTSYLDVNAFKKQQQ